MIIKVGDILFEDSDKIGPKIVKYFMRSPNLWVDLWRIITNTVQKSEYYHPVLYVGNEKIIEQQWKVEYSELNLEQKLLIARKKDLRDGDRFVLKHIAELELGYKWGILNVIGKFLTWITGFKIFGRIIRWSSTEVSALRIARWYYQAFQETFGQKYYHDNTTKTMVDYIKNSPDWEIIYEGDGNDLASM